MNLVILGPLENRANSKITGGAIVQLKHVLDELNSRGVVYEVIDTNKHNYTSKKDAFIAVVRKYYKLVRKETTVLYFTSSNYKYFLPVFGSIKKLIGNKLFIRKIGGDIGHFKGDKQKLERTLRLFKKTDHVLVETQGLQKLLSDNGVSCTQFLNARKRSKVSERMGDPVNLAYFGRISKSKGLLSLIEIDLKLPKNLTIDIFGPLEDLNENSFSDLKNIIYKGALDPKDVSAKVREYKAVILPTQFYGEGHPGIIVEALMSGRPVLATNWHYISELVEDEGNGILFKSNEPTEILEGINRFMKLPYNALCENAKNSVQDFDIQLNVDRLLNLINYDC